MSNAFENLGYAASNELSPDAWKGYMLDNLNKQDQYQQEWLNQYIALQQRAEAKAKKQALVSGIKTALQYGMSKAMEPKAETPLADTADNLLSKQFETTNVLDQFKKQPNWQEIYPWENK